MTDLLSELLAGDRRALARAITQAESTRPQDQVLSNSLLDRLPAIEQQSIILGISGTPGVGKSSFINELGCHAVDRGHRLAVLAVDPSSTATRGSILGDKTRMLDLARHQESFIRPSPSAGVLGGVAAATRKAIRLCEAAGHNVIIVETVGIGQSEVSVEAMVDLFVLLIAPGGGDDVQGIKRGVMELVDAVIVNKDDGDRRRLAQTTVSDYRSALHLFRAKHPEFGPSVLTCSAVERRGIQEAWDHISELHAMLVASGSLEDQRRRQRAHSLVAEVTAKVTASVDEATKAATEELRFAVQAGTRDPSSAAQEIVDELFSSLGATE